MQDSAGLYIHVPFCREKCHYCSFYSEPVAHLDKRMESYIQRLSQEISHVSSLYGKCSEFSCDTIYFGGGTPSVLGEPGVSYIMARLHENFKIDSSWEVTLEMNPHDLHRDFLSALPPLGINRLSLGVQTLDEKLHKSLGRSGRCCGRDDLDVFFSAPVGTRSVDIMTGLPGQNEENLLHDLKTIGAYRPEHISLYVLSIEEGTPLHGRFRPDDAFLVLQDGLWDIAIDFLKEEGYVHYEVSNFALPGSLSRHNMKYWNFSPYIGMGPGAHSFVNNERYSNPPSLEAYLCGEDFNYVPEPRGENDRVVEYLMTAIRCLQGFSLKRFEEVTGAALPHDIIEAIDSFVDLGFMTRKGDLCSVTHCGLKLLDDIIYKILANHL